MLQPSFVHISYFNSDYTDEEREADEITSDTVTIKGGMDPEHWQPAGSLNRQQSKLTATFNKLRVFRFKRLLTTKGQRDRYYHQCGSDASAWLDALGTRHSGTAMSNTDFKIAVHILLGIAPVPNGHCATCSNRSKKNPRKIPHSSNHAFTCMITHCARTSCHHDVNQLLGRTLKTIRASGASQVVDIKHEAAVIGLGVERQPIAPEPTTLHTFDAYFKLNNDRQFIVDVSSIHPTDSRTNSAGVNIMDLDRPAERPNAYLEKRDQEKIDKYEKNYQLNSNFKVVPFVFATYGRLSQPAIDLVSQLAKLQCCSGYRLRGLPLPYSLARRQLAQRISVTIQSCHARLYRSYNLGHLRKDLPVG